MSKLKYTLIATTAVLGLSLGVPALDISGASGIAMAQGNSDGSNAGGNSPGNAGGNAANAGGVSSAGGIAGGNSAAGGPGFGGQASGMSAADAGSSQSNPHGGPPGLTGFDPSRSDRADDPPGLRSARLTASMAPNRGKRPGASRASTSASRARVAASPERSTPRAV